MMKRRAKAAGANRFRAAAAAQREHKTDTKQWWRSDEKEQAGKKWCQILSKAARSPPPGSEDATRRGALRVRGATVDEVHLMAATVEEEEKAGEDRKELIHRKPL
jgi:hypothetical protein